MKQYVRRNSRNQTVSANKVDQQRHDDDRGPASDSGTQLTADSRALVHKQGSPDPYSFDCEDKLVKDNDCPALSGGAKAPRQTAAQAKRGSRYNQNPTARNTARFLSGNADVTAAGPLTAVEPADKQCAPEAARQGQKAGLPATKNQEAEPTAQQATCATAAQQLAGSASTAAAAEPAPASASAPGGCSAASGVQRAKISNHTSKCKPITTSDSQGRKVASSGRSRKAAQVGVKRNRGTADAAGIQHLQHCSPTDATPTFSGSLTPAHGNNPGAVTLPTPHHRPRSSRLLAFAAAVGGTEVRPAQTVMEAQERGELVQMQDDASYAMDGLNSTCSIEAQRDSAVILAEMLSTRKGRVALRADGLSQQFLTRLAKLKAAKDPILAMSATLSLWHLASEDANPCYLASVAAAVLVDQLLQSDFTFEEVTARGNAGTRLCRVTRSRPLNTLLDSAGVNSMRGLVLVTLEQATSSMHASKAAAVEKLKHNLRQHGVLQRLAGLVSDIAVAPGGAVPAAQQLHQLLLVLENATFTCLENGTALTAMQVKPNGNRPGTPGPSSLLGAAAGAASDAAAAAAQPFPAVLVSVARQLLSGMDQEQPRAALHALLSVLMNLIHDNKGGGALLCSLGAMDVAAEVYSGLLQPCASRESALCVAVLQHLELLSVALGVLMNLVSNEPQHSQQLAAGKAAAATVAAGSSDGGGGDGHGDSTFVALLCTVVTALSQMLQRAEDEDAAAQETGLDDSSGVTAAEPVELGGEGCGHPFDTSAKRVSTCPAAAAAAAAGGAAELSEAFGNNKASEASIVEVYSSILLGFLVRDGGPQLAQAVAAMLPGGSLDPLLSSTARCLDFYMRTGAITDHTRTTLEGLMRELAALQMGQQGVDQGLRSVQMNATQEVADAIMVE